MRKWITTLTLIGVAVAAGLVVRQILQDLSDDSRMWQSVTDEPVAD